MENKWFNLKTKVIQKIAQIFGVKVHVFQGLSNIKTIDTDDIESPNDYKQPTSVPERQIGD